MDRGDAVDLKLGAGVRVRQSYASILKFKAVQEALGPSEEAARRDDVTGEPKSKVKLPMPRNRAERRREQKKRGEFKGRRHR